MAGATANRRSAPQSKVLKVDRRRWSEGPRPGKRTPLLDQVVPAWRTSEYFLARVEEQIFRGRFEKRPFAVLSARIPERPAPDVVSLLDLAYIMELIENDALRPNDLVCLLATNEIGVLIADSALENLEEIAELIADCFDDDVRPQFGVSIYPQHGETARELINRAKLGLPRQQARIIELDRFRRQRQEETEYPGA